MTMTTTQSSSMNTLRRTAQHCLLFAITISMAAAETANRNARETSKPFYLRDIQIGDSITLPFSPVTAIVMLVSVVMLGGIFKSPKSTATASHILVDGSDAEGKLTKIKKEIGSDYGKFKMAAKVNSKCPSGKTADGKLGTFKPGMMVPAFDKAIFSKENKVGEVIGPIQTTFGWHLIWIEERDLVA